MKIKKLSTYNVLSKNALKLINTSNLKMYIKLDLRQSEKCFLQALECAGTLFINLMVLPIYLALALWHLVIPYIGVWKGSEPNEQDNT